MIETVQFEFGLRETGFSFVEGYAPKATEISRGRSIVVLLSELVSDGDVRGIDG